MTSHASKPPGLPSTTSGCGRRALTAMLGASGPVSYTHLDVYKRQALQSAGIGTRDIDAINAHGTGTQANDATETAALKAVFGARAHEIPVSATKAMHGHLLGAAGALEAVLSLLAMQQAVALPTMHLQQADPECDLDYVANAARHGFAARTMLSNSFAFGGTNACLLYTSRCV